MLTDIIIFQSSNSVKYELRGSEKSMSQKLLNKNLS